MSRLNRVTGHGQIFTFSYLENSHLIDEVESGVSNRFERHINRQTNSHRISSIENEWSQTDRVNFTYSYDTLGRVSTRVMTGTIVDAYGSNTSELRETYTYNDRHELTKAKTESKISGTYHELVVRKHAFTYDHQGNRKTHSRNSNTTTYTPNNLNQYTAKTNHGYLLVEGTSTNATVKVYETGSTEATATRKNNYYFRDWDPDTTSTASDYPEINIKEGTRVSDTKNAWIPVVSESPTYDANGNLTGDALWSYTYDEENRLIQMTETSAAATAGFPDTTITFKYDYLGRRVEKKVVRGTTTETHLRFVWRGWLLVAELNAASNNDRVKTYTWGPDISGSFGGAGGNGGVLIFRDHTRTDNESFFPAYDAQGNVTGLIDTSGNLVAAYEYDPFGKLIRYAGTRTASMSLLYGTKYLDMETGLIYYGYRYYDPRQGRFINRDPIGEFGGINLYGFVGNSPTNWVDFLGLTDHERRNPLPGPGTYLVNPPYDLPSGFDYGSSRNVGWSLIFPDPLDVLYQAIISSKKRQSNQISFSITDHGTIQFSDYYSARVFWELGYEFTQFRYNRGYFAEAKIPTSDGFTDNRNGPPGNGDEEYPDCEALLEKYARYIDRNAGDLFDTQNEAALAAYIDIWTSDRDLGFEWGGLIHSERGGFLWSQIKGYTYTEPFQGTTMDITVSRWRRFAVFGETAFFHTHPTIGDSPFSGRTFSTQNRDGGGDNIAVRRSGLNLYLGNPQFEIRLLTPSLVKENFNSVGIAASPAPLPAFPLDPPNTELKNLVDCIKAR